MATITGACGASNCLGLVTVHSAVNSIIIIELANLSWIFCGFLSLHYLVPLYREGRQTELHRR